jgi:hypothetical protein
MTSNFFYHIPSSHVKVLTLSTSEGVGSLLSRATAAPYASMPLDASVPQGRSHALESF